MTERGCEARISSRVTDHSASRQVYDLDGRLIDRGPKFAERSSKATATIDCSRCGLCKVINTEGGPPFGAVNEADRQVDTFIKGNCRKLREFGYSPDQMPRNWIPR